MSAIRAFLVRRKLALGGLGFLALSGTGVGIALRAPAEPIRYVLAPVERRTIVASLGGSGQVSSETQLDIKAPASGAIAAVAAKPGEAVAAGTVLFALDDAEARKTIRDAGQAVNDARLSLDSAQIALRKLRQPADAVAVAQARHAVEQARRTLDTLRAGADPADIAQSERAYAIEQEKVRVSADGRTPNMVREAYEDATTPVKNASQTVQDGLGDLEDLFAAVGQAGLNTSYEYARLVSSRDPDRPAAADNLYQRVVDTAAALKRGADGLRASNEETAALERSLEEAREALVAMDPFLRKTEEFLDRLVPSAIFAQTSIDGYRATIRADRTDVLAKIAAIAAARQAIDDAKTSFEGRGLEVEKARLALEKLKRGADANDLRTAEERLEEALASQAKLEQGASALDLASSENTVSQRRSSLVAAQGRLADAQVALADYVVKAPFDGLVAAVPVRVGDQASPSTVLATFLAQGKVVSIPFNEVDISKIRIGQRATLVFDAVPGLQIAGTVAQVDTLATVSQGVVTYAAKVAFQTDDERVKPGMSATATIILEARTDVFAVPNAALQSAGGQPTVRVLAADRAAVQAAGTQGVPSTLVPEVRAVETGLANDQSVEIISGLQEGEYVVTRTVDPNAAVPAPAAAAGAGALRIPGLGGTGGLGGAGGAFRAGGR